jgi:N-acetylmuramoyl-L-alanine amidase
MLLLANTADAKALLENIRISKQPLETRLVFDLTDSVNYKILTLNRPNRLVIDLYNAEISSALKSSYGSKGLIKQIRLAKNSRNKSRIVIETTEIVFYKVEKIPKGSNKNFRVVVDLKKAYEGSRKLLSSSVNRKEFIVAIDPGHGGKDPGARGSKVIEKDLVLKISKRLKKLIDSEKNMKAFLTRTDDSFPCPGGKKNCAQLESLNERISRAKKGKADLLISIHADAFTDPSIRGATLYALTDSRKVSKGSNYKIMYRPKTKTNIKLKPGISKRSISTLKISQVDTHDQSIEIGNHILKAMKKDVRLRKLSPREAAFAVLKSTEIASVLIETSYLSNKNDEAFLVNPKNQDKIAKAIVRGIKSYSADAKQQLSK